METLQRPLKGIILVVKIHEKFFTSVTLPRGAILSYYLLIFVYRYFLNIPLFLENHLVFHITFFKDVLGYYLKGYLTKKNFLQHVPLC